MKVRPREINIFNMSLIDILCGALGAFCFMMLVLLPYYKPPGSATDLYRDQAQTQELLKEMERLKEAAKDSALAQQMTDMMRRLEEQIKKLQGQVNQYAAQNQQLQTENDGLTKKNQKQTQELNARNPFSVYAGANDVTQAVDIYLQDDLIQGDKHTPPFNPAGPHQSRFWNGDIDLTVASRGIALWGVRDSPANVHYKVYLKLANNPAQRRQTGITSATYGGNYTINFPEVTLSPQRFWTLVGTLMSDPQGNGSVTFKEATQAERDAEWSKLSKSAPPSPPTTPQNPAARQIGPGGMAPANNPRDLIEQRERERQQRQQSSPAPSP